MDATGAPAFDELAAKVSELAQVCMRLSQENASLRREVSRLSAGTTTVAQAAVSPSAEGDRLELPTAGPTRPLAGKVSRRMMGRAVGAAAVTAMGVAAMVEAGAQPAAAATAAPDANGDAVTAGNNTKAESVTSVTYDGTSGFKSVVLLGNDSTYNLGTTLFPAAVGGLAGAGSTAGAGGVANGMYGFTDNGAGYGVVAYNSGSVGDGGGGVLARADGSGAFGVRASNLSGTAVSADGTTGVSASGSSVGVSAIAPVAVKAAGTGSGQAVSATNNSGTLATIKAVNSGTNSGIHATSQGRGGVFGGNLAQIQLTPGSGATHPKGGSRGDLYADKTGRLWFCKTGGTTATWHQIA